MIASEDRDFAGQKFVLSELFSKHEKLDFIEDFLEEVLGEIGHLKEARSGLEEEAVGSESLEGLLEGGRFVVQEHHDAIACPPDDRQGEFTGGELIGSGSDDFIATYGVSAAIALETIEERKGEKLVFEEREAIVGGWRATIGKDPPEVFDKILFAHRPKDRHPAEIAVLNDVLFVQVKLLGRGGFCGSAKEHHPRGTAKERDKEKAAFEGEFFLFQIPQVFGGEEA